MQEVSFGINVTNEEIRWSFNCVVNYKILAFWLRPPVMNCDVSPKAVWVVVRGSCYADLALAILLFIPHSIA